MNLHIDTITTLLNFYSILLAEGDKITLKYNLTQQQFVVLNYIKRNKNVCHREIRSKLLFKRSNTSKIVAKLNRLDYIKIIADQDDKRLSKITCSKLGERVVESCLNDFNAFNQKIFKETNDYELIKLNKTIIKIQNELTYHGNTTNHKKPKL